MANKLKIILVGIAFLMATPAITLAQDESTDRTTDDKYEIQTKIEEITNNSFFDKLRGVILKPSSVFEQRIRTSSVLNPIKTAELYGNKEISAKDQLAVMWLDSKTGEWKGGAPMYAKPIEDLIKEIFLKIMIFIIPIGFLLFWLNKKIIPSLKSEKKRD